MYCVASRNWHHHARYMRHLQQLNLYKVMMHRKIRQHQGMMLDTLQKLYAITARKQDIMQEISHHQWPKPALEYSHYKCA